MHFGSNVLLSTLTLNITASEPRLDTSCWLDITRWGLHPLYDISLNPSKEINTSLRCVISLIMKILLAYARKIFTQRTVLA